MSLWTLVVVPLVMWDAVIYIQKQLPHEHSKKLLVAGLIAAVITMVSMGLHEFGHGIMAYWLGEKVVGAGFYGLFAYVRTETALVYLAPSKEILISFAGPLMNFIVAAIVLIPVVVYGESIAENTMQYIAHINILLGIYNLIPFPMFDGGKFLQGFLRIIFGDSGIVWILVLAAFAYVCLNWSFVRSNVEKIEDKLEEL